MNECVLMAMFSAATEIAMATTLVVINWRAATGRLNRSQWAGIRTPSTLRSDQGWVAGHSAALPLAPLCVVTTAISLLALPVAATGTSFGVAMVVGAAGLFAFLPIALYSALIAGRAVKQAQKPESR